MQICQIPYDTASAADNMAIDATMLAFGAATDQCMWRVYGWTEASITFGYSQSWGWIQANVAPFKGTCIRRITGGGIVDHRNDLTYAISIPPSHPAHRRRALDLYEDLHMEIVEILMDQGIRAELAPCGKNASTESPHAPAGVCFEAPEPFDVIDPVSRSKLAGAAMKRNHSGVLIQGSLALRSLAGLEPVAFAKQFGKALSHMLKAEPVSLNGTLPLDTLLQERERFEAASWNQRR